MPPKAYVLENPYSCRPALTCDWCVLYVRYPELFDTAKLQESIVSVGVFEDGKGALIKFNPCFDLEEAWLLLDQALTDAARFIETFQHALD